MIVSKNNDDFSNRIKNSNPEIKKEKTKTTKNHHYHQQQKTKQNKKTQKTNKNHAWELGVVAHAFNPSFWEANTGGALGVRGQPGLHSETYLNKSKQQNWSVQLTSPDGSAVCSRECDRSLSLEWPSFYNRAPLSTLPQPSNVPKLGGISKVQEPSRRPQPPPPSFSSSLSPWHSKPVC